MTECPSPDEIRERAVDAVFEDRAGPGDDTVAEVLEDAIDAYEAALAERDEAIYALQAVKRCQDWMESDPRACEGLPAKTMEFVESALGSFDGGSETSCVHEFKREAGPVWGKEEVRCVHCGRPEIRDAEEGGPA